MDTAFTLFILIATQVTVCKASVIVGVTIKSYSNPNGTCYVETSSDRKCCDGPQREMCDVGDTCDTYFDICVGVMEANWGCKGAFFQTKPLNDTNDIGNLTTMESRSDEWGPGMSIFVFVRDDDSHGTPVIKQHEHIDTLIDEIKFVPSASQAEASEHHFEWDGKTRLSLAVSVWCDSDYYGQYCSSYCRGISPMAVCESDGKLSCQPSDALLLEFKNQTSESQLPDMVFNINRFMQKEVCRGTNSKVLYPVLDPKSNTFTFTADCGNHQVTPIEFESVLKMQKQSTLDTYFSAGVLTGAASISGGYGEHIKPNVYVGVELKALYNPTGTSYNGELITGKRRCCDEPRTVNCVTAQDACDLQASICIGEFQQSVCIGAVTISPTYTNTSSISTCGSTFLDLTNNIASVSHPMMGGLRLTQNLTSVNVIVKDSDLNGNSSDIIDVLGKNITVVPGPNVTYATSVDVKISNIASVTLRLIFWCAPGHSGPLCHADNGTDTCEPGWYGNECEFQLSACSPNPCKHGGRCNLQRNNGFNCTCDPGYTGVSCEKDVDECTLNICQNNATCQNTDGGFNCMCASEWTGLICTEDKIPACDPNPCAHGNCILDNRIKENFRCNCDDGWKGTYCNEKNICEHGVDRTVNGIDTCTCNPGFTGTTCSQDINECLANPCGNGGHCQNGIGNFSCTCDLGFGGKLCQNNTGACKGVECQNNGSCLNLEGAFLCMCTEDFTGDFCETKVNHCGHVVCDNNGTCQESFHDFMCNCSQYWSGKTCDVDINECVNPVCKNGGLCSNIQGSFTCDCPNGWTGMDCSSDVDECKSPFQLCKYGQCTNSPGSYKCACTEGYSGPHCLMQSTSCINVTCNGHGSCYEVVNGHACKCNAGFTGTDCENDINECNLNMCGPHANKCSNSQGSYNCTCNSGWQGHTCTDDIDECSSLSLPCSGNGICSNTPGSYSCTCFPGFSGSNCSVFLDLCVGLTCKNNGTCVLRHAEAKCACAKGWTGIKCEEDVNECKSPFQLCKYGQCTNSPGSYKCACTEGYSGPHCLMQSTSCINVTCNGHGSCYEVVNGHACKCNAGFTGTDCENDINECNLNMCGPHANKCSNSQGSYNCTCNSGWQGHTCTDDIDECSSLSLPCSGNGICSNTPGSYSCTCFPGFSGSNCSVFLDLCVGLTCKNNGTCVLRHAEAKCACAKGWTGIKCEEDVNECESLMPCQNSGICQNVDGSYYCRCLNGWTGSECETDVNECLTVCKGTGTCSNVPGSFSCACQQGWIGMYCEIKNAMSIAGRLISLTFQTDILKEEIQATITYTKIFLSKYICNNQKINFYLKSIEKNNLQFKAQCDGYSVSAMNISDAISNISNDTLLHIFPSPLIGIHEIATGSSTYRTNSDSSLIGSSFSTPSARSNSPTVKSVSSLASNQKDLIWPVVAGCCGAFVLIVIVVALGIYRIRRVKHQRQEDSFANPSYNTELQPYDE